MAFCRLLLVFAVRLSFTWFFLSTTRWLQSSHVSVRRRNSMTCMYMSECVQKPAENVGNVFPVVQHFSFSLQHHIAKVRSSVQYESSPIMVTRLMSMMTGLSKSVVSTALFVWVCDLLPRPHNHSFLMGHMSFCIAIDGLFRNYFGLFHIISGYFGVLSYWFLSYAPDKQTDLKMLPTPTIKMLPMPTDDIVSVGN